MFSGNCSWESMWKKQGESKILAIWSKSIETPFYSKIFKKKDKDRE